MTDFRVEVVMNRLPEMASTAYADADRRIDMLAQLGRNYAVLTVQTPSPGTAQTRYSPKRTVTAAAPGETPNTDIGTLVNTITVQPAGQLQREIAVGAAHGLPLEVGTPNMAARPFMSPMALWLETQVSAVFAGFLD